MARNFGGSGNTSETAAMQFVAGDEGLHDSDSVSTDFRPSSTRSSTRPP